MFASGHVGEEENLLVALENGETGESRISGGVGGGCEIIFVYA